MATFVQGYLFMNIIDPRRKRRQRRRKLKLIGKPLKIKFIILKSK